MRFISMIPFQNLPFLFKWSMGWLYLVLPALVFAFLLYRIRNRASNEVTSIAFFHPFCIKLSSNDGGGGERVLWKMIESLCKMDTANATDIVIYSGDDVKGDTILANVNKQFGINLSSKRIRFVHLKLRFLVEAQRYPRFTLILQGLGSFVLGLEALYRYAPTVFIDTMGYSFTFPVFKLLGGCHVSCYVHYPTIRKEMLSLDYLRNPEFSNNRETASSTLMTHLKLWYFRGFYVLYKFMGAFSDLFAANSSWTGNHLKQVWSTSDIKIIYPPCETSHRAKFPLENRSPYIVSIGQFRPEKDHLLQVKVMKRFKELCPNRKDVKLIMIGSKRLNSTIDDEVLSKVEEEINLSNLQDQVIIQESIPKEVLDSWLQKALVGIHTMSEEHFGIGIVELMASGLITIAHNSGGPRDDIIVSSNQELVGYLATNLEEYAQDLVEIFKFGDKDRIVIQQNSRSCAHRFSDETFDSEIQKWFCTIPAIGRILKPKQA